MRTAIVFGVLIWAMLPVVVVLSAGSTGAIAVGIVFWLFATASAIMAAANEWGRIKSWLGRDRLGVG